MEHKKRGADISKIVTAATTMEEQIENLRIVNMLKKELDIPFLFLSGGPYCTIARRLGGAIGNCMTLCVYEHDEFSTKAQPLLKDMKLIRDSLGF
jgi:3-dehydroquinate dehydratase